MEIKVRDVVERTFRICDICKTGKAHRQCKGCGIDLCRSCCVWWSTDPWSGDDGGDYPDCVCEQCQEKATPFVSQVEEIRNKAEEEIEKLYNEWKEACAR